MLPLITRQQRGANNNNNNNNKSIRLTCKCTLTLLILGAALNTIYLLLHLSSNDDEYWNHHPLYHSFVRTTDHPTSHSKLASSGSSSSSRTIQQQLSSTNTNTNTIDHHHITNSILRLEEEEEDHSSSAGGVDGGTPDDDFVAVTIAREQQQQQQDTNDHHHMELNKLKVQESIVNNKRDVMDVLSDSDDRKVLTAFVEPLFDFEKTPLPSRLKNSVEDLKPIRYPQVNSCSKLTAQLPIDKPPADEDAFLPWLHDVFPSVDGKKIHFIAQHRRRCHVGEKPWLEKFAPQASLFQHIPVKRLNIEGGPTQYKLTSHENADEDGQATRFICRFHSADGNKQYETLSVYPFDYDYLTFRKGYPSTFTKEGKDVHMIWSSQLYFDCPVPEELQTIVQNGESVVDDYARLYVDLVPIRSAPRYTAPSLFLPPKFGIKPQVEASEYWGDNYILPKIEASGRLANIPICRPPTVKSKLLDVNQHQKINIGTTKLNNMKITTTNSTKPHRLVACTWASTSFKTRGARATVNDGKDRLKEWIVHNLNVGFDHIYVYDNSGAFTDEDSLESVVDMFPADKVTRVDWPAKVCNNNPGRHPDKGERSSQYAAEASCRTRFGSQTDWLGFIDTDEFLIPKGNFTDLKEFLDKLDEEDIRIIGFPNQRSRVRYDKVDIDEDDGTPSLKDGMTHMEAYNCDLEAPPKSQWMKGNEKQLYRPDYVLHHFIHYSTCSTYTMMSKEETRNAKLPWRQRGNEEALKRQRLVDEVNEALLLHSKSVTSGESSSWYNNCKVGYNCKLGFPFLKEGSGAHEGDTNELGFLRNCYVDPNIESIWLPRLKQGLALLEETNTGDNVVLR